MPRACLGAETRHRGGSIRAIVIIVAERMLGVARARVRESPGENPEHHPGDALLFRLDAALQHRATPVSAGTKTAFAGWYFGGESYPPLLRALAEP